MVIVAVRGGPVAAATLKRTLAEPAPLGAELMAIHSASADTVHMQSGLDEVTSIVPEPPAGEKLADA